LPLVIVTVPVFFLWFALVGVVRLLGGRAGLLLSLYLCFVALLFISKSSFRPGGAVDRDVGGLVSVAFFVGGFSGLLAPPLIEFIVLICRWVENEPEGDNNQDDAP